MGFALGFGISLLTIVLTSVRIARFNVIAAIRDLDERLASLLRAALEGEPAPGPDDTIEIMHSPRFVLVDGQGQIRCQ